MPHSAPRPWWRQLDRVAGISLAVLGLVILLVAVLALRQPKGREAAQVQVTDTTTTTLGASDSSVSTDSGTASSSSSTSQSASSSVPPSPSVTPSAASSTAATGVKAVPLVVLNNTTKANLAQLAAQRFQAGGWTVTTTGNLVNNIISTCAYYDPSIAGAQAAATALQAQFPTIKRVKPKFSGLPAGPVVVVLANDYS